MSNNNYTGQDTFTTDPTTDKVGHMGDNAGQTAGNAIKSTFTKIHGAGEALRGNVNAFLDSVVNTDSSRSRTVAERGASEMRTGVYQGSGAGVTPKDTERERLNRDL